MKHLSLIASALAVLGLTACEKGLDVVEDGMSSDVGQVKNSVLQVRTRSGGSGSEATVAYPVTVYVFSGDECKAAQTIGDAHDGGTNTVTLGMTRKTMLIQRVEIKKVPTAATAVSVTIAPYVLSVTDTGADVDILLLSPDETTCLGTDNAVQTALGYCGTADIDDWSVPTKQQMQLVEARLLSTDATLAGTNYLFRRTNGVLGFRTLGDDENAWPTASTTATYRLRPVAIVTIPKE